MAFFKNFFNNIYDTVTSIPSNVGNWLYNTGNTIKNGISSAVKQVGDWYKDFTGFTDTQNETKRQFDETLKQNQEQYETTEKRLNKELEYNKDVSDQNLEMQQNQFDYQKQLNNTQMEREDTAIQRQMADAQAAGLSPLSVIGGNGASSSPLQSASAPQRDVSGINSITGQYVDLAKEYATLQNMARNKYSEMRQGANMALMQMRSDSKYKALSASNSLFNSAINAKNARLNNEYVSEQIKAKKYENDWYKQHGWQSTNPAVLLSDFLNSETNKKLISQVTEFYDKAGNKLIQIFDDKKEVNQAQFYSNLKSTGLSNQEIALLQDASEAAYNRSLWQITKDEFKLITSKFKWFTDKFILK